MDQDWSKTKSQSWLHANLVAYAPRLLPLPCDLGSLLIFRLQFPHLYYKGTGRAVLTRACQG